MVHPEKLQVSLLVGDTVVLPAQGDYLIPGIVIMPPVPAHADGVHMMDICRGSADTALPVPDTAAQVMIDIVCPVQPRFPERHPVLQAEVQEHVQEASGRIHLAGGKAEQLPAGPLDVVIFHSGLTFLRKIACPGRQVIQRGVYLLPLVYADPPAVKDGELRSPAALALQKLPELRPVRCGYEFRLPVHHPGFADVYLHALPPGSYNVPRDPNAHYKKHMS